MAEKHTVTERLARTQDGRLVPYEDTEAAFLAYRPGDEIPLDVARAEGLVSTKEAPQAENKMERPAENKGGLSVHRLKDEPEEPEEEPEPVEEEPESEFVCPECGFEAKSKLGLGSHRRHKHGVE